jgi:hypothetical protein
VRKDIFELETLSKKFEEENGTIDSVRKQICHGSSTHSYFNCINDDAEYFPYCKIHIDVSAEVHSISETRVLPYDLNKPYPAASTITFSFGPHDYSTQSDVRFTPEFLMSLNCIGANKCVDISFYLQECTSSNRRIFSSSCPENSFTPETATINACPSSAPDQTCSSEKLAAEDTSDSDCEVFRVKRRSGITPDRRRTEDVTLTSFTENQVQIFLCQCSFICIPLHL